MMYNKRVQEYFFLPRHVGLLDISEPFTVHHSTNSANQNEVIDLYMRFLPCGTITKVLFKSNGNPYIIAALELLASALEGSCVHAPIAFDYKLLIDALDIPVSQSPGALLVEHAYKKTLSLMKKKIKGEL